jgi:hypothetical protein
MVAVRSMTMSVAKSWLRSRVPFPDRAWILVPCICYAGFTVLLVIPVHRT